MGAPLKWQVTTIPGRLPTIEVSLDGYVSTSDLRGPYGLALEDAMTRLRREFGLLFLAHGLTGIDLGLPVAHATFLLDFAARIRAVATVSDLPLVRFGMASAALVLNRRFRTFETREEAINWLLDGGRATARGRA
jgi:hypothetical protein